MNNNVYALITAAKNEEHYIGRVLDSISRQTRLPRIWLIVSDGSTDRTDEIVEEFSKSHDFIRLLRLPGDTTRAFSSQAFASNKGFNAIKEMAFDFVGFIDADISLGDDYYEKLLLHFESNTRLGITGGQVLEESSGAFAPRYGNSPHCVAGAIQMFRRECYEEIGGLIPLSCGGHDHIANAIASAKGWEVQSFADLPVYHHRPTGTEGTTMLRSRFRAGMEDYYMGYHPVFEIAKCVRRFAERPFLMGSVLRLCGYTYPAFKRTGPELSPEVIRLVKKDQARRVTQRLLEGKSQ